MSYARFNGFLRPYQGFKNLYVLRRQGAVTDTGRPVTGKFEEVGQIIGMLSQADQKQKEQWKQNGHPITHTIVQRGTANQAKPTDVILLEDTTRSFLVHGVVDPGEIGHFSVYYVEERLDLKMGVYQADGKLVVMFGVDPKLSNSNMRIK